MSQKNFTISTWVALSLSILLPFAVWGNNIGWSLEAISLYSFFPLLGLLAWMIMWTHYTTGAVRIKNPDLKKPPYYSKVTGYVVLSAILLHPGILALAQFRNDAGLPPASLYSYLGDAAFVAVLFGTISWVIFLSFEYFNRNRKKLWVKKSMLYISISQSIAMILIFVHALRIGSDLNTDWFRVVWVIYGLILIPCFYIIHKADVESHRKVISS